MSRIDRQKSLKSLASVPEGEPCQPTHTRLSTVSDSESEEEEGFGLSIVQSQLPLTTPKSVSYQWTRTGKSLRLNTKQSEISYILSDGTAYNPAPPGSGGHASCIERCFAPTSVKGAVFNLVTAIVGSGILSFPFAFRASGVLWGMFLLSVCTLFAYISFNLLIIASANMRDRNVQPTFLSLAYSTGGKKLVIFTQIIISIQLYGSAIGRIVGSGEILTRLYMKYPLLGWNFDANVMYTGIIIAFCAIVVFPLSLMKNMSSLRFSSLFCVCCACVLAIVLFAEYFILCDEECFWKIDAFWNALSKENGYRLGSFTLSGILTSFPIILFAYDCHANVFPIYAELGCDNENSKDKQELTVSLSPREPNISIKMDKIKKVFKLALSVAYSLYTIAGPMAFMIFFDGTCGNILLNDFGNATEVTIASLMFAVSQIFAVPVLMNAIRGNINEMIWKDSKNVSTPTHVFLTFLIVLAGAKVAIMVDDVSTIFGFLGCTAGPIGGYVLPTFFVWKLVPKTEKKYNTIKWIALIMTVIISVISMGSLAFKAWSYITENVVVCDAVI